MSTPRARNDRRFLLALGVVLAGCRPAEPTETPKPDDADAPLEPFPSLEPPPTPVDLSPDPLPEGVAAAVNGEPIAAAEVEDMLRGADPEADPEQLRTAALVMLIERRLLRASADSLEILATDAEIDQTIDGVATSNGLSREQLQARLEEEGSSWEEYRDEVMTQLIEFKVLRMHGLLDTSPGDVETPEQRRARFMGCMRARAEVQVADEFTLPDNPYGQVVRIDQFRFSGAEALPAEELERAARKAAATRLHLCDGLTSAELAVEELYVERGYLDARARMPWPASTEPPLTIEVQVTPGLQHVVGRIAFDQSAVPRGDRVDEAELRTAVEAHVAKGQIASHASLRAAAVALTDAAGRHALALGESKVDRKEAGGKARLNITFRLVPLRAPTAPTPPPTAEAPPTT